MGDFCTLSCPSCGGKLQITKDIDRFACGYCGHEHVVKRSGGIVSLSPVVEALRKVEVGVDKTAAELAIVRLDKELAQTEKTLRDTTEYYDRKIETSGGSSYLWLTLLLIVGAFTAFLAIKGQVCIMCVATAFCIFLGIKACTSRMKTADKWRVEKEEALAQIRNDILDLEGQLRNERDIAKS